MSRCAAGFSLAADIFRRQHPEIFLEALCEIFRVVIPHGISQFTHSYVRIPHQQAAGCVHPDTADERRGVHACERLQFLVKRGFRHAQLFGKLHLRELNVVDVLLHQFLTTFHERGVQVGDVQFIRFDTQGQAGVHQALADAFFDMGCSLPPAVEQVFDTCYEQFHAERFGEVGVGSQAVGHRLVLIGAFGGEQQHRDVADLNIALDDAGQLQSVHLRHHDVADNHLDIVVGTSHTFERFLAVLRGHYMVMLRQHTLDDTQQLGVVFHQQDIRDGGFRVADSSTACVALLLKLLNEGLIHVG